MLRTWKALAKAFHWISVPFRASYTFFLIERYSVRIFLLSTHLRPLIFLYFFSFPWFDCYPHVNSLMRTPRFDDNANDTLADLLNDQYRQKRKSSLASYSLWAVTPKAVRVGNWNLYFWKAKGKSNPKVFSFFKNMSLESRVLYWYMQNLEFHRVSKKIRYCWILFSISFSKI